MERLLTNHHSSPFHHLQTTVALARILHNSQNHSFQLSPQSSIHLILLHRCFNRSTPSHTTSPARLHCDTRGLGHQTPFTHHRSKWRHHSTTHLLSFSLTTRAHITPPSTPFSPFISLSPLPQPRVPPISLFSTRFSPPSRPPFPTTAPTHTKSHSCGALHQFRAALPHPHPKRHPTFRHPFNSRHPSSRTP